MFPLGRFTLAWHVARLAHYDCSGPIKKTNEARAYHVTQRAERGPPRAGLPRQRRRRCAVGWKVITFLFVIRLQSVLMNQSFVQTHRFPISAHIQHTVGCVHKNFD